MAGDAGNPPDGLVPEVPEPTRSDDFYATVRVLEAAHRHLPRVGEAARAGEEGISFGQRPSLGFEPAAVVCVEPQRDGRPQRVEVSFFGVFGANGPLPLHLTEYAYQRIHHAHDTTLARFADVFHHRLLALLYRTWAVAQPTVSHDRPTQDAFARHVSALAAVPRVRNETRLDRFARSAPGPFAGYGRHPEGLEKLVSSYFGCVAKVEEYAGEWLPLPDQYCWRIASSKQDVTSLGMLGESTRIGKVVWSRTGKFQLVLGPLSRAAYERLLPGAADAEELVALVQRYVGPELSWDVRLILQHQDLRPTVLGEFGRLGRDAYLLPPRTDDDQQWADLVFDPVSHAS
jgi:type VI secretion system protein ImpH